MNDDTTVLVVGSTGRTGGRVLTQLLERGVNVRTIVRSRDRLPAGVADDPRLSVLEADFLSLSGAELSEQVRGCDAVVSCLGHTIDLAGVFGRPRDLVERATERLCRAIQAERPSKPVRYVLMSSVSVNRPGKLDARRGALERGFLWALRGVLPPARDNQRAADFLCETIGTSDPFVQWVAVRPDTLMDGDVTEYTVHECLVDGLFAPGETNMANVAHFMCELACEPEPWNEWGGGMPVIVNVGSAAAGA